MMLQDPTYLYMYLYPLLTPMTEGARPTSPTIPL